MAPPGNQAATEKTNLILQPREPPAYSNGNGVRPAKAGVFSGRQAHRGRNQSPVAWMAGRRETEDLKPIDRAIFGMVRESPGRNASELMGGPDRH